MKDLKYTSRRPRSGAAMSGIDLTEAVEVAAKTAVEGSLGQAFDWLGTGSSYPTEEQQLDDAREWVSEILEAALPLLEQQIRSQIEGELRTEAQHARDAYLAAETDHFAHDYCRWVGHAEALSSAAERIARTRNRHE